MRSSSKANKQSNYMLMKIIRSAIIILCKARDFYMKSLEDCAGMVGRIGGGVVCPAPPAASHLPKSFSFNSSVGSSYNEEFKSLLRSTSKRGSESKVGQKMQQQSRMKQPTMTMRSYSVGVGKIGRIDEDKPCSFEEDDSMADLLYSRSRSYAVRRNLTVYR